MNKVTIKSVILVSQPQKDWMGALNQPQWGFIAEVSHKRKASGFKCFHRALVLNCYVYIQLLGQAD